MFLKLQPWFMPLWYATVDKNSIDPIGIVVSIFIFILD